MDRKVIRDWFLFLLMLIVFPADSRVAAEIKPEDWYGELQIPVEGKLVVVGKNSTQSLVNLGLKGVTAAYAIQPDRVEGLAHIDPNGGLPNGIVVAEAPRWSNYANRAVNLDGKHYFSPSALVILTRADLYTAYVAGVFVAILFMVLGFVIAQYSSDEGDRRAHAGELRMGPRRR
jgi:hypothetical protein